MAFTRVCTFCLEPIRECVCEDVEPPPTWDVPPLDCVTCGDTGHVCAAHPSRPSGIFCCEPDPETAPDEDGQILCEHGACHCWPVNFPLNTGSPCPDCASPVAADDRTDL